MAVRTDVSVTINSSETGSLDLGSRGASHLFKFVTTLTSGTSNGQADIVWSDKRTLSSTSEDLDVAGALTGALGDTIAIVELVGVAIKHNGTSGTLSVGAASAPITGLFSDTSDEIVIQPGGVFLWLAPNAGVSISAGSTDDLKVDASATIEYEILLLGRSA